MLLSNATFQLLRSEQRRERLESEGDVKRIWYVVSGGGGGRGIDRGGATRVGRVDRCVSIVEIVDAVGEVARRVCVSKVVWLIRPRRVDTWVGVGGDGAERRWAVHFVRSKV